MTMDVDESLIKRVAQLARLNLTDSEIKEFTPQLKEVLDSFSELDDLDVDSLAPSYQPVALRNALRDDTIRPSLSQQDALKNAKHTKDGYFKGPKAV